MASICEAVLAIRRGMLRKPQPPIRIACGYLALVQRLALRLFGCFLRLEPLRSAASFSSAATYASR